MKKQKIAHGLKESSLTPAYYKPSEKIKTYEHIVITANGIPFLGLGVSSDSDTLFEANKLVNLQALKQIIECELETEATLNIETIHGSKIEWKDKEIAICKSDAGKIEYGNEDADLHWLVYGENSLAIATALCLSEEIQNIAI